MRTKYIKGNLQRAANVQEVFSRQQKGYLIMFLVEGTVLQREACTMVVDSCVRSVAYELCYLNVISKLSTIGMIALGAIYHLSCLAVLVNCTRQHNNGKVTRKEKRNC